MTAEAAFRPPTAAEARLLAWLAREAPAGCREILARQVAAARVRRLDDSGSLAIETSEPGRAVGYAGAVVTGLLADFDTVENSGPYINYIIMVRQGVIYGLDVYKDDGTVPRAAPDPDAFAFVFVSRSSR